MIRRGIVTFGAVRGVRPGRREREQGNRDEEPQVPVPDDVLEHPQHEVARQRGESAGAQGVLAAYAERELSRHYVSLLKAPVADVAAVEALSTDDHRAVVRGRACHLLLGTSYVPGDVDPLKVDKHIGVGTSRNYNVITTLARKWC